MKLDISNYQMQHRKNINVSGKFINRELSWLAFNERVLYYAKHDSIPLNERLKFLAITESNLDEFLAVRFSYAYTERKTEPYKYILKRIKYFKERQTEVYELLKNTLVKKGLKITKFSDLSKTEKHGIFKEYMKNIFPLLTPVMIGTVNQQPSINSGDLCIAVGIKEERTEEICVIPIPKEISTTYEISDKLIFVEDIIQEYLGKTLFINKEISCVGTFRIIRDASIILSHDDSRFIVDRMNDILKKREDSTPIFLEVSSELPEYMQERLGKIFSVAHGHVYNKAYRLYLKRFMKAILDRSSSYEKFEPFEFDNYENYFSIFDALSHQDILLHHPYDSYETVVKFIEHAAIDNDVVAIKQTLYRVSSIDSPIVNALCKAAKNGKHVSVLIEIKARFDEENNINLIEKLKNSGAIVLLGLEYLKTHCKMCIVIRKEQGELKMYSHVGTGNYNEQTAKIYTDLSYLTKRQKVGIDLLHIFNIISGHSRPDEKMHTISYSPVNLRKTLLKCIDREIENAKKGKPAEIFLKVNSISDKIMVNALYEAASKGVEIYIICRGICSIAPRKNIYIKSIVGRFLEHSRIYYFNNNKSPEYYVSSADLLTRNLDKRVETLISLKDNSVIKQVSWMIDVLKQDEENSFVMFDDTKWIHLRGEFNAHEWFLKYSDIKKRKKKWRK